MSTLLRDIRFALRQLRNSPGFTLTAVLTLALGIGANASIFTLVHAVLLRNLPVTDPKMLVRIGNQNDCCVNGGMPDNNTYSLFAYDMYTQIRDNTPLPGLHENNGASWTRVSPEFLDLIGEHLVRGRGIEPQDTATAPGVAVVNQAFVKRFFPNGEEPIGKHFGTDQLPSTHEIEIVGIVKDVKYNNLRRPQRPMYFRPLLQVAPVSDGPSVSSLYIGAIMLQMHGAVDGFEPQVRRTLASINPNLTPVNFMTFDTQIDGQFDQERLVARLTLIFGVLALVLASIGLYGVTAYVVARRTAEIGIRMAPGATRERVVKGIYREAMIQTAIGLAVGVPVALLCVRFVKSQLYNVGGYDPTVLVLSLLVLVASSAIATLIPAIRAASIDPVKALRTE
jgi:macrolide transport system ATP-binding/permease protein